MLELGFCIKVRLWSRKIGFGSLKQGKCFSIMLMSFSHSQIARFICVTGFVLQWIIQNDYT